METEKRLSTSQLFALIFILGVGIKMLMLPVLLLKSCGRDSLIIITAVSAADLLCLAAMLVSIKLCPAGVSFFDVLRSALGRWGTKILCAVLTLFFTFKLLLTISEINSFVSENLLKEYYSPLYSLPIYAVCVIVGMGTLRAAGRAVQFLFPFVLLATVLLIALVASGVDFAEVLPFGEFDGKTVTVSAFRFAVWDGDFTVLVVVLGSVKKNKTVIAGMISGVAAAVTVIMYVAGLTAAYSNVCYVIRYGQSINGMSHYAMGNVMQGRIDLLLFCVWLLSAVLKVGFYSFAATNCASYVIRVKKWILSLSLGLIALFVLSVLNIASLVQTAAIKIMPVPSILLQFSVPVISLIAARRYSKRHPESRDGSVKVSDEREGALNMKGEEINET